MYWVPYLSLAINLIVIWFMPKHLTNKEIYVSWAVIAYLLKYRRNAKFIFSAV
ncbi:hypothetical protein [Cytobacillus sp. FSL H8-0458]|uniref:hypothetical protein n=1 Tax=Cytobacillus sp. FSL H8-0458 TaxID=2975346 RepID=UPI0030F81D9C